MDPQSETFLASMRILTRSCLGTGEQHLEGEASSDGFASSGLDLLIELKPARLCSVVVDAALILFLVIVLLQVRAHFQLDE